jgi:dipeptidyl-peptidase-4
MYRLGYFIFIFTSFTSFSQSLTVEDIWRDYKFYARGVDGFRSMNDGEHFTQFSSKGITKHSFRDYQGQAEVILSKKDMTYNSTPLSVDNYEFNSDETKVLLMVNQTSIYRRSYTAVHYLFDLETGKLKELDIKRSPQTQVEYSPDGKSIAYIFENNLYVKDLTDNGVKAITTDGERNKIINGTTDWVYEEEFAITKAYGWSPDSKHIAYLKFDESNVKEYSMKYFNELYPDLYTFKYPKAGEDNSIVTAHIANVVNGTSEQIDLGEYEYIPRLKWSHKQNQLILQTLNRHQNHLSYHLVEVKDGNYTSRVIFEEKSKTYIDVDDNLLILNNGNSILRTSESNGFNHIYQLNFDGSTNQITQGNWDVIEFLGIDNKNKMIYFTSAEKGAIHKGIYKIDINGKKKIAISKETGSNGAMFSAGMKYFVKSYSNANTPPIYSLCDNKGKQLEVLEDNSGLEKKLSKRELSLKEFVTFKGAETELNGWMIKPKDFDPSKKYPVYMNIYGGPGSNMVSDSWGGMNYMYHQLLAQSGYIVVSVDPRGTMYRGTEFKKSTYLELGKLETEDMIAVAKELQSFDFVDPERIGIMGWSYGGFMTSLAMTKGADQFKMGIAVAPVTNWRYYDNIYTERFMRTPQENENGYDQNSPINFVDQLKGKYLLIHGSGDDNVHYQNTMEMINALVAADKQFDLFIYPNKNHGIYGGNTRNHLFKMMYNYTLDNL